MTEPGKAFTIGIDDHQEQGRRREDQADRVQLVSSEQHDQKADRRKNDDLRLLNLSLRYLASCRPGIFRVNFGVNDAVDCVGTGPCRQKADDDPDQDRKLWEPSGSKQHGKQCKAEGKYGMGKHDKLPVLLQFIDYFR